MDRLPAKTDLEHLRPEPPAAALLTGDVHVLEEVHLQLFIPVPLAPFASTAGRVEREVCGGQASPLGLGGGGKNPTHLIEHLQIGHRVGAWRPADRLLIDQTHPTEVFQTFDRGKPPHGQRRDAKGAGHGPIEGVLHQRAFPRARYAGHADQRPEREPDGQVFQIMLERTGQDECVPAAFAAGPRHRHGLITSQVSGGEGPTVAEERIPGRRADHLASFLSGPGA